MLRSFVVTATALVATFSMTTQAFALDCRNVSGSEYTLATTAQPILSFPMFFGTRSPRTSLQMAMA